MRDRTPHFKSADGSFTCEFDPAESCAVSLVQAVAAVSNREPTKMAPLYETIDADALDALMADRGEIGNEFGVRISFEYERHEVTMTRGGKMNVKPLQRAR